MIKFLSSVAFGVLIVLGVAGILSRPFHTTNPSVTELQKSVLNLQMTQPAADGSEVVVGVCSGWVLEGSHNVVTAAHCLEGGQVKADFGDGKYRKLKAVKIGDMSYETGPDLAILTPEDDTGITYPVGLKTCTKPVQIGDPLALLGSPLGIRNNASFGHVSNTAVDVSDVATGNPDFLKHFIGYDGQLFPGNSGGPAISLNDGCVVGVAEFIIGANQMSNYGINGLTPIGDLAKLQ